MRRITAFLLACAFVLGGIGAAGADGIDIKVWGRWDFAFGWVNNKWFKDNVASARRGTPDDDNFEARQRIRTQINFISSEYLQAVLQFEMGDLDFGRPGTGRQRGAGLDADGVNIETRRAYIDWLIPNTEVSVRMGIQGLTLPSTRMGNVVFDADVAGVIISSPITDWLSATAFWVRPFDQYRNGDTWDNGTPAFVNGDANFSDAADVFGLVLPVTMNGWSLSPYFLYGWVGANSGYYDYIFTYSSTNTNVAEDARAKAWWLGANLKVDAFDPLAFDMDVIYGHLNQANLATYTPAAVGPPAVPAVYTNLGNWGAEGWYIGATLDYKLDFMTPGIFGWWASGDDKSDWEDGWIGRMPVLGIDMGFMATTFGVGGYHSMGNGGNSVTISQTATGTWGIGVQLADVTFVDDLSHTLRVIYYRGTNDPDLVEELGGAPFNRYGADPLYLTSRDSVWEVNFDHQYKIYENLTAVLELGYLHLNADRDTWGGGFDESDDAWKAEVMFTYSF
jgi:hypothetical protein